jgi:ABC-type antimicrobial peptide transport system permease subunit
MVVTETLIVVASGVVAGLGLAVLATRGLEGLLFGVAPMDGVTFSVAALLLLGSAAAAAFVPARRAARADPVNVLKR